jgi:hypothetical protein
MLLDFGIQLFWAKRMSRLALVVLYFIDSWFNNLTSIGLALEPSNS